MAAVIGIVTAESETTFYIMDDNGQWRECTPSEALYAQHYMNKFEEMFPNTYSDRTWGPGLSDYDDIELPTPTATPTATPTVKPTQVPAKMPEEFWRSIISNRLPERNYNLPSKILSRFR
jgi:hypothetical protein